MVKENVNKIKEIYKNRVNVILIKKDYNNIVKKTWLNIDNIDNYIKFEYTKELLYNELKDIKLKI